MEKFTKVSGHINQLIICFGTFFNDGSITRDECLEIAMQSTLLHHNCVERGDLISYDMQIELAKKTYKIMLGKVNIQQIVDDILYCGSSDLSWEATRTFLLDLYRIDMHIKEIYAFYYLHEINNMRYIDGPLPSSACAPL